jgi:EpsI family protein
VHAATDFSFLRRKPAIILTCALLAQAVLVYGFSRTEFVPNHEALKTLSAQLGGWMLQEESPIDQETLDILKADDTLSRTYVNSSIQSSVHLFVAFFKSQRTGQTPHSPKNCLPGSGWVPSLSDTVQVDVPGRTPLKVNRYIVQKGDSKSLVLYWYQSRDRVVASEYEAKFYVVADAVRYNRTDTALVRVIVPLGPGQGLNEAQKVAFDFIQSSYIPLRQHFPA